MIRFDRIRGLLKREEKEAEKFGNVDEIDYLTTLFEDLSGIEKYVFDEKDRKKRRNKQIKDLKKEIKELTIKHQKFIKDLQKNTTELNR